MSEAPVLADPFTVEAAVDRAARAIPPLWPLASSVAVNPFLGQSGESLARTAERLSRVAGVRITPNRDRRLRMILDGTISEADLQAAWSCAPPHLRPADLDALKAAARRTPPEPRALPTVADLAAEASGVDWPGLIAERISAWAAGYFDEGQALWAAPRGRSAFAAWRAFATHDLTPEIAGLKGFALHVSETPDRAAAAIARAVERLGLGEGALETFLHQMHVTLGGWSQYARYRLWQAELAGGTDEALCGLLAIRLVWEEALLIRYGAAIAGRWAEVRLAHAVPIMETAESVIDSILQTAAERAAQRALAASLAGGGRPAPTDRPVLQAAFCIDVRSEVFRRSLESLDPGIRTLGFAGFFGLAAGHRGFASDVVERRFPVLLNPGVTSCTGDPDRPADDLLARVRARATRAWGRFKLAAVSSFAFVEATGPIHVGKLLGDALGLHDGLSPDSAAPRLDPALDAASRIQAAETVLRAMSLTTGFAPLVLLTGHGANVVNNPHASGLHCGACGGYPGDVNARLLAGLLNDPQVRAGQRRSGQLGPFDQAGTVAAEVLVEARVAPLVW